MKFLFKTLFYLVLTVLLLAGAGIGLGWHLSTPISDDKLEQMSSSPQFLDGIFVNIERQAANDLGWDYLEDQLFGDEQREPPGPLPLVRLDTAKLANAPEPGLRATWLGHSSVLIEIDGHRVMLDPAFSQRASPFQFIGPKRMHPLPFELSELTGIDAVVVSHNHYDHMDEASIRHLAEQGAQVFVPLGMGELMEDWDVPQDQLNEFDWNDETTLGDLRIIATSTRHYSGRGLFDYKKTLWSSWTVIGPAHRVFYSGDTGYSSAFKEIGAQHGPFDLSVIKVGSYGPGQSWSDIHMSPEEAAQVHLDLVGGYMLPVHWATFNLALHPWDEPIRRIVKDANKKGIDLLTPKIGETVDIGEPYENEYWWEGVEPLG